MTTTNADTTVVGKSIYIEFRDEKNIRAFQLLLTPKTRVPSNPSSIADPTMYRRQLTPSTPKRQWKCIPMRSADYESEATPLDTRLSSVDNILQQLVRGGYKVFKEPIIVDTSEADLDQIRKMRTPYKLIGRVEKVRKAKGFPSKVLPGAI